MRKIIFAVDFDGTLSLGSFPECGPPNEELITVCKDIISRPREQRNMLLILWTSRKGEYLDNAVEWSREQGIIFDGINALPPDEDLLFPDDNRKLWADYYIDDRAYTPAEFCNAYLTHRI